MNVVVCAVNDESRAAQLPDNAAKIRKEIRTDLGLDQGFPLFGAENQVHHHIAAGLCHVLSPFQGLSAASKLPRARALGCILAPLRGSRIVLLQMAERCDGCHNGRATIEHDAVMPSEARLWFREGHKRRRPESQYTDVRCFRCYRSREAALRTQPRAQALGKQRVRTSPEGAKEGCWDRDL